MASAFGALSQLAHAQNAPTLTAEAAALEAERAQVQAWIDTVWEECDKPLAFPGIEITYERRIYATMNDAELAAAEQEVEGKPEHPKRQTVARDKRLRKTLGYSGASVRVFVEAVDRWRLCSTPINEINEEYTDSIESPSYRWRLTPNHLVLARPGLKDGLAPDESSILDMRWDINTNELAALLLGDFVAAKSALWRLDSLSRSGTHAWSVLAQNNASEGKPIALRFVIERSKDGSGWDLASATYTKHGYAPRWEMTSHTYHDWRFDPVLKRRVAGSVDSHEADGRRGRSVIFVSAKPREISTDLLFTPPTVSGTDPIRGSATFRSVRDFCSGESFDVGTDRKMSKKNATLDVARRDNGPLLKGIGWSCFALLTLGLLYVRWRQRDAAA